MSDNSIVNNNPKMMDAALSYAGLGWRVIPLNGKVAITPHGLKDGSTDEATIKAWWTKYPTPMWES